MERKLSRTKICLLAGGAVLLIALIILVVIGISQSSPEANEVQLSKNNLTLNVGEIEKLTATATNGGEVVWLSSDAAVATVKDGTVTAVAPGKAIITATAGEASASCHVTVVAPEAPTDPSEPGPIDPDPSQGASISQGIAGFTEEDWKGLPVDTSLVWGTDSEDGGKWGLRGDLEALEKWKWYPAEGINTLHNPGTQFIAWPTTEATASDGIAEAVFANKVEVSKSRFVLNAGCDTDANYIHIRLSVVLEDGSIEVLKPKSFVSGEYAPGKDGWGTIHKSQWVYGAAIEYDFSAYVGQTVTILLEQDAYNGANPTIWLCKIEFKDGQSEVTKVDNAMWVIGDSIMTQEFTGTMVGEIADETGFTLFRDTISGSTIAPASSIGIVDHIDSKLYENDFEIYGAPKLILIQRGSNDLYWSGQAGNPLKMGDPSSTDKKTTYGAIRYILDYLTGRYPEARIIWSTTFFRTDVDNGRIQEFNNNLKAIASEYDNVEILDLYELTGFNAGNAGKYMIDGIHPSDAGKKVLKKLWIYRIENHADEEPKKPDPTIPGGVTLSGTVAGFDDAEWKLLSVDASKVWGTNDENGETWGLRGDLKALEKWQWYPAPGINTLHNPGTQFIAWPTSEETASDGIAEAVFANKVKVSSKKFVLHAGCDTDANYINIRLSVVLEDGSIKFIEPKGYVAGEYTPKKNGWGTIHKSQWVYGTKIEYDFSKYVGKTVTILIEQDAYNGANPTIWMCKMEFVDDSQFVEPEPVPEEVKLDKTSAALLVGETVTVKATASQGSAIIWKSSDEAVAVVENGVITAVGPGSAKITASAGDASAVCNVTVVAPSETTLSQTVAGFTDTEWKALEVDNSTVWGTDDADGGTWGLRGDPEALAKWRWYPTPGVGTLTNNTQFIAWPVSEETASDGIAEAVFANKVVVSMPRFLLNAGCDTDDNYINIRLSVVLEDGTIEVVEPKAYVEGEYIPGTDGWGTVHKSQWVYGTQIEYDFSAYLNQTVTILLEQDAYNGANPTLWLCKIAFAEEAQEQPDEVTLDKNEITLNVGETAQLQATVTGNAVLEWYSSDETVVTVENGVVTAVAPGSAKITASAGNASAVCNVTVVAPSETTLSQNVAGFTDTEWKALEVDNSTVWGTGDADGGTWGLRGDPEALAKWHWYPTPGVGTLTNNTQFIAWPVSEETASDGIAEAVFANKVVVSGSRFLLNAGCDTDDNYINIRLSVVLADGTIEVVEPKAYVDGEYIPGTDGWGTVHKSQWVYGTQIEYDFSAYLNQTVTILLEQDAYNGANPTLWLCKLEFKESFLADSVAGFTDTEWKALEVDPSTVWGTDDADGGTWGLRGDLEALAKWHWYPTPGVGTLTNNTQFIAWPVSEETASDGIAEAVFANKVVVSGSRFLLNAGCDMDDNYINIRLSVVLADGTIEVVEPKAYVEGEYIPGTDGWGTVHKSQWVYGTQIEYDFSAYLNQTVTILLEQDAYNGANPTLWLCKLEMTE